MIATVLNNLLQSTVLANVPINSYITALLFGIVLVVGILTLFV
ncbi:hypothetical protein [Laedolimicola intestinihominis]|uniref:NADH dehydrogenase subunit 6 n=1 Tax=Laedolimicola intestinihominis TaxID=3133166 RepID=A0ABV1FDF3_9FIRM